MENRHRGALLVASNFNAANNAHVMRVQTRLDEREREINVAKMAMRKFLGKDPVVEEEESGDETVETMKKSKLHKLVHKVFQKVDETKEETTGAEQVTANLKQRLFDELGIPNYGQDPIIAVRQAMSKHEEQLERFYGELEKINAALNDVIDGNLVQKLAARRQAEKEKEKEAARARPASARKATPRRKLKVAKKKIEPEKLCEFLREVCPV